MLGVNVRVERTTKNLFGGWNTMHVLEATPALQREVLSRQLATWRSEVSRLERVYAGQLARAGRYYPDATAKVAEITAQLEALGETGPMVEGGLISTKYSPPVPTEDCGRWLDAADAVGLKL